MKSSFLSKWLCPRTRRHRQSHSDINPESISQPFAREPSPGGRRQEGFRRGHSLRCC